MDEFFCLDPKLDPKKVLVAIPSRINPNYKPDNKLIGTS